MKKLNDLHNDKLNFNGLCEITSKYPFKICKIDFRIYGLTTNENIYLNENIFKELKPNEIFMVVCHELTHYLSINKIGLNEMLDKLNSDEVINFVIHEEQLADRNAMIMFYKLNGYIYDGELNQNLHLDFNKQRYSKFLKENFVGKYPKTINEYKAFIKNFIN